MAAVCLVLCGTLAVGLSSVFASRSLGGLRSGMPQASNPAPSQKATLGAAPQPAPTAPAPVGGGSPGIVPWAGETCSMYAVQDFGKGDTTLLRFDFTDPLTGDPISETATVGNCAGCDLEAIALHPETGVLYAISGSGTPGGDIADGDLATIDRETGAVTAIGSTGAFGDTEIVAASFRPSDNTLWAFQSTIGLVSVDLETGNTTLEFPIGGELDQFGNPVGDDWEGLAWDPAGELIYGSQGSFLYRYDPLLNVVEVVCNNLGEAGFEVEALEYAPEGFLVGSRSLSGFPELIQIGFPEDSSEFGAGACTPVGIVTPTENLVLDDLESLTFVSCPEEDDEGDDETPETPDDEDDDEDDDHDGDDEDDDFPSSWGQGSGWWSLWWN